jgi:hypothetical protein
MCDAVKRMATGESGLIGTQHALASTARSATGSGCAGGLASDVQRSLATASSMRAFKEYNPVSIQARHMGLPMQSRRCSKLQCEGHLSDENCRVKKGGNRRKHAAGFSTALRERSRSWDGVKLASDVRVPANTTKIRTLASQSSRRARRIARNTVSAPSSGA